MAGAVSESTGAGRLQEAARATDTPDATRESETALQKERERERERERDRERGDFPLVPSPDERKRETEHSYFGSSREWFKGSWPLCPLFPCSTSPDPLQPGAFPFTLPGIPLLPPRLLKGPDAKSAFFLLPALASDLVVYRSCRVTAAARTLGSLTSATPSASAALLSSCMDVSLHPGEYLERGFCVRQDRDSGRKGEI